MKTMKKGLFLLAAFMMMLGVAFNFTTTSSAHSIDYLAALVSPSGSFNGNSGNFSYNDEVAGGTALNFSTTFQVVAQGGTTTFPRTIAFGSTTQSKPAGASDVVVSAIPNCTFTAASGIGSSCTSAITITTPSTPGAYTIKISPTSGTGGQGGLSSGGGLAITFTVAAPVVPECAHAATSLALSLANNGTVLYHATSTTFSATLTAGGNALPNKEIVFAVDGTLVGNVYTDTLGSATFNYDPSLLSAGNHTVTANFAGDSCDFNASANSATMSVNYVFLGFQQPINGDGSSIFGGKVVPVKIRIADANGAPVPNAAAYLYYRFGIAAIVGTEGEQVASNIQGDVGNAMRYDAAADQYIFNWNVGNLTATPNGTYTLRVDLGEGESAEPHTAVVSLNRKK